MNIQLYIPHKVNKCPLYQQYIQCLQEGLSTHNDITLTNHYPTLIHVFGAWNQQTYHCIAQAHRLRIPTVYSPLGELAPWWFNKTEIQINKVKIYLQKNTTHKANKIVVWGEQEKQCILQKRWNQHIEIIKNPIVTNSISAEECTKQLVDVYQQTIKEHNLLIHQQISNKLSKLNSKNNTNELSFCHQLLYLRYQYHRRNISTQQLNQMATALKTIDYDEDKLENIIIQLKEKKFAARIIQILSEQYQLTEGFMPFAPVNDKQTKKIKNVINNK